MKLTLNARLESVIRLEVSETVVPDDILVTVNGGAGKHFILRVSSPTGSKDFNADKEVNISEMCRKTGTVQMTVLGYDGGVLFRKWRVEPLILRESDESIEAIPQVTEMEERLAQAEQTVITLKQALAELYNIVKG